MRLQFTLCCSKRHCGLDLLVHHALHLHVLPVDPFGRLTFTDPRQVLRGMHLGLQMVHRGMFGLQPVLQTRDLLSQCLLKRNRDGLPPCDRGHLLPLRESGRSTGTV